MANFFPKKLLELDSFLKVRDTFVSLNYFFGPCLCDRRGRLCVDSVLSTLDYDASSFSEFLWGQPCYDGLYNLEF